MRTTALVTALLAASAPLQAEPSQAYFSQGLDVCLAFGNDGFFVVDRLEEKGWTAQIDPYYETVVLYTPGRSVWVVPPPEGAAMPARCAVISGAVGIVEAEAALRFVLSDRGETYLPGTLRGCPAFQLDNARRVHVFSDGQDDLCNDPRSARVDVVHDADPAGAQ